MKVKTIGGQVDYSPENGDVLIPPEITDNGLVRVIRYGRVLRNGIDFNVPPKSESRWSWLKRLLMLD